MTPPHAPLGTSGERDGLVDFKAVVPRLFWAAVVLAGVAVVGAAVQGVIRGLTFAVLVQWGAVFAVTFVLVAAVMIAAHAIGGARAARRRGERLASDDIGVTPRGGWTPRGRAPRDRDGDRTRQRRGGDGGG